MLYYRYRPFSELSIKELMYNELFLASTKECNDPYDSKSFYEFSPRQDYWENFIKLISDKVEKNCLKNKEIKKIAIKINNLCPLTYDEALRLDISNLCYESVSNIALCRNLSISFNQHLKLYKPEPSYFACFSKADNDPLMWSHYASQHQGFCLIFKPIDGKLQQHPPLKKSSIRRSTPNGLAPSSNYGLPESFSFQDVIYQDNVKPLCGFHRLPVAVVGGYLPEEERIELVKAQSEQFLHKHISWQYEQESRVSITPGTSWLFGENIELTALERLFYYEPTQLAGVIFGAKMPQQSKDRLIEVLLYRQDRISRSADYERIIFEFAVFNAQLSSTKREIQIEVDRILTLSNSIDKSHENFDSFYERWKNGWGIKLEGSKSSRVQIKC